MELITLTPEQVTENAKNQHTRSAEMNIAMRCRIGPKEDLWISTNGAIVLAEPTGLLVLIDTDNTVWITSCDDLVKFESSALKVNKNGQYTAKRTKLDKMKLSQVLTQLVTNAAPGINQAEALKLEFAFVMDGEDEVNKDVVVDGTTLKCFQIKLYTNPNPSK
jgi:hypothetical protein